jgi:hypothetical protein
MATDLTNAIWRKQFDAIRRAVADNGVWGDLLGAPGAKLPSCGIHLAVFVEPFLGYVLDGSKTVESRFSVNRCAPFGRVSQSDVVLLKRAGGPVVGIAQVRAVWSYHLDKSSLRLIRKRFAEALHAQDPGFWEQRREATYATLMSIEHVLGLKPLEWKKRDRRGWVVIRSMGQPSLFGGTDERCNDTASGGRNRITFEDKI